MTSHQLAVILVTLLTLGFGFKLAAMTLKQQLNPWFHYIVDICDTIANFIVSIAMMIALFRFLAYLAVIWR